MWISVQNRYYMINDSQVKCIYATTVDNDYQIIAEYITGDKVILGCYSDFESTIKTFDSLRKAQEQNAYSFAFLEHDEHREEPEDTEDELLIREDRKSTLKTKRALRDGTVYGILFEGEQ